MQIAARAVKNQRGATVIEFALVIVLLLILIFGIIETGLYVMNRQIITNACREGARYGIVVRSPRRTNAEIQAAINLYATSRLVSFNSGSTALSLTFTRIPGSPGGCDAMADCRLRIDASYRYTFLILPNLLGIIRPLGVDLPESALIRETVTMRYE